MSHKYLESFFKFSLMVLCLAGLLYGTSRLERAFSIRMRPPAPMAPTLEKDEVEETLADLHAPLERLSSLNTWIRAASRVTSLDPILLCCLIHSESRFKKDVVSPKGYMGEAQTKRFSQYSSVNILEGAETLREKLSQSSGDILEALARYKGGKGQPGGPGRGHGSLETLPVTVGKEGSRQAGGGRSFLGHGECRWVVLHHS